MKLPALMWILALVGLMSGTVAVAHAKPSAAELDTASKSSDFSGYYTKLTVWLNSKAPVGSVSAEALTTLVDQPEFRSALNHWQFLDRHGVDQINAFAKADVKHRDFLTWLLANTEAMDLYLEGVVPIGIAARAQNNYRLRVAALERWQQIYHADPDSRQGLYLKLAMAVAIAPPGTGSPGAGQKVKPAEEPLSRYAHYKLAHQDGELFPSFNHLTVWELQKVVNGGASNADLAWAREMINTWRPDLRENELVVNSTSQVWRRNSPHPYSDYKTVLSGGGKCGPRSSWSVMICQAFGIPAIGVGQPGHACVAYKTAFPQSEPQPGSAWKVGYGRGWHVSRLDGLSGLDFLAGVEERSRTAQFSHVEQLRWFASALSSSEQSAKVMAVAQAIQRSVPSVNTDVTASANAEEAEKEIAPQVRSERRAAPDGPIKVATGTTRIAAEAYTRMNGVAVYDAHTGGKQVNFQAWVDSGRVDYTIDVASAGTYELTLRIATPNYHQMLNVTAKDDPVTSAIPNTTGLWATTEPMTIELQQGVQTLQLSAPNQRGVAVYYLELKSAALAAKN